MTHDPRLRVAVIGGGESVEHAVSLASAAGVASALDPTTYDVVRLTIGRDGSWPCGLAAAVEVLRTCAVVIPVLHGPRGEDGTVAALCDLAHVPYVGSGVAAGALAMDKWATKLVAASVGIATAPATLVTAATAGDCPWSGPVVVKPVKAGSSHGVTLVRDAADLQPAIRAGLAVDDRVLVEDVVHGREIDLAVLGRPSGERIVAPALEVVTDGVFDLTTKYDGSADLRVPAALLDAEREELEAASTAMYDALGCGGVARVDFFLTADGPVLNEVNTMPGFTEQSQVPKMFAAAGTSYSELLDLLVGDVLAASGSGAGAA